MKQIALLLLTLLCLNAISQQSDTLTNEKVIKLFKAGFSKDVLKPKIQSSPSKFDVTIDGMLELKKEGIPEDIINLMIANPNGAAISSKDNPQQSSSEKQALDLSSGIYYKNPSGEFTEIEPSVLTNTKSNNAAQFFISGLINAKTKATLSDRQSSSMIYESIPAFYFVFDTTYKSNLNSENNTWFGGTRSPKEFLLVKLEVNKNSRELTVGKGNIVSSDFGIDEKLIVHFNAKKLSKGIYEVTPEFSLPDGEYCFMFAQGIKQGESSKVFDFSIRHAKGF